MGWNKTEEKLPEPMLGVLVYNDRTEWFRVDYLITGNKEPYSWAYSGLRDMVTHWMDLPDPPIKDVK
jgi:hypothetical protein